MEEPRPANNGLKEERGGAFSRSGIGGIDLFGSFPRRRRASSLMAHRVEGLRKIKFDRDHFMFTYTIPPDGHIERLFPTGQLRNGQMVPPSVTDCAKASPHRKISNFPDIHMTKPHSKPEFTSGLSATEASTSRLLQPLTRSTLITRSRLVRGPITRATVAREPLIPTECPTPAGASRTMSLRPTVYEYSEPAKPNVPSIEDDDDEDDGFQDPPTSPQPPLSNTGTEEFVNAGDNPTCLKPPPDFSHPAPPPEAFAQNIFPDLAIPLSGVIVIRHRKPPVKLSCITDASNPIIPGMPIEEYGPMDIEDCAEYADCSVRNGINAATTALALTGATLFVLRGILECDKDFQCKKEFQCDKKFLIYPAIGIGLFMFLGSVRTYLARCGTNDVIFTASASFLCGYFGAHYIHYIGPHWYPEAFMTAIGAFLVVRIVFQCCQAWPIYY